MTSRKRILAHPAVKEMWQEKPNRYFDAYDGDYWIALNPGWWCPPMECHIIREPTLREVWSMLAECKRCNESGGCPENCEA